jgi:hypothetical protein
LGKCRDRALARPIDRVVVGSLFGGAGGARPLEVDREVDEAVEELGEFRGNVENFCIRFDESIECPDGSD